MAHGVAQSFLDDPADRRADDIREIRALRSDRHLVTDLGTAAAPERDQILDRLAQAEFGEPDRAQPAKHASDLPLHVANGLDDRADMEGGVARAPIFYQPGRGGRVGVDREQVGAHLVVQVAGELAALLLLQRQQPLA
jgi:hypothetical protein